MRADNENGFSLLKLLAETELQSKVKRSHKIQMSTNDTNGITETIRESLEDQTITIDDEPYVINAMEVENNKIILWLWSDSADEEKTIQITLKIDELDTLATDWNG